MIHKYYLAPEEQNEDIMDGVASPKDIWKHDVLLKTPNYPELLLNSRSTRVSTPVFPKNYTCLPQDIPISLMVTPKSNSNVYYFDEKQVKLPKCPNCSSYFTLYTDYHSRSRKFLCPTCLKKYDNTNNFEPIQYKGTKTQDMEIITEEEMHDKENDIFLIAIDISTISIESKFAQSIAKALIKILPNSKQTLKVCIVTYSDEIHIFDPKYSREIAIPDLDNIEIWKLNIQPLSITLESILNYLSKISNLNTANSRLNCLGAVLEFATKAIPAGGVLLLCTANYATIGPGIIIPDESHVGLYKRARRTKAFYNDMAAKFIEIGITCNLFMSTTGDEFARLTAVPSALTSGYVYIYKLFNETKDFYTLFSDLTNSLQVLYFWHAHIDVVCNPSLNVKKLSLNALKSTNKSADVANFPFKNSILVKFEFPRNIISYISGDASVIQLHITFRGDDGKKHIRVFTHAFPVTSDSRVVEQRFDPMLAFACYVRNFVDCSYFMFPMDALREMLEVKNEKLRNIIKFFYDTPILRENHPNGEDGKVADLVALKTYDVLQLFLYIRKRVEYISVGIRIPKKQIEVKKSEEDLQKSDTRSQENQEQNPSDGQQTEKYEKVYQPICMMVQTVSSIGFFISPQADKRWLYRAFGTKNPLELPLYLPKIDTQENKILWDFTLKYSNDVRPNIYLDM